MFARFVLRSDRGSDSFLIKVGVVNQLNPFLTQTPCSIDRLLLDPAVLLMTPAAASCSG